jgi:hypothetical protein
MTKSNCSSRKSVFELWNLGKAIKSKEDWFEDDNEDELNDTREFFANQTDDEDLFKIDRRSEDNA